MYAIRNANTTHFGSFNSIIRTGTMQRLNQLYGMDFGQFYNNCDKLKNACRKVYNDCDKLED